MSRKGLSEQKRQDSLIAIALRKRPTGGAGTVTDVTGTAPIVITNPTTTPNVAVATPARTYLKGGALTLNAGSQVNATGTITPTNSGKIKVTVTGVLHNSDTSATQHPCVLNVSASAVSGAANQSLDTFNGTPGAAAAGKTPFSFVVDLDQATTPHTFALGEVVTVNVNLTGDASGDLSVVANGVVADVQEEWR